MDEQEQAAAELAALAKVKGALKIITSAPAPTNLRAGLPTSSPHYFVQHDVVRIVPIEQRGTLRAYSAEGDWCEAQPAVLLTRLREWRG